MNEADGTEPRPPGIRAKWFVADETIGVGKIRLLEKVGELGSISAAARQMGMGYRRAWFLITSLQQGFDAPLIETVRGETRMVGRQSLSLAKNSCGDLTRMKRKSSQGLPACQNGCRLFRQLPLSVTPTSMMRMVWKIRQKLAGNGNMVRVWTGQRVEL